MTGRTLTTLILILVPLAGMAGLAFVVYDLFFASSPVETAASTTTSMAVVESTTTTEAGPTQTFTPIQDTDRYGTAIAISKQGFPQGAPAAVLVPGETFRGGPVRGAAGQSVWGLV